MKDVLDAIIFYDGLSGEQQSTLRAAMEDNPDLFQLFQRWQQIKVDIRDSLNLSLPDRELLVLYTLQQNKDTYITPSERRLLAASTQDIEHALQRHPVLNDVVADITEAQHDFINVWQEVTEGIEITPPQAPRPVARIFSLRLARIAAVLLVAVLTTYSAFSLWQNQQTETIQLSDNDYRTVHFEDGSSVRLVGASALTYSKSTFLNRFDRNVKLDGQAFFDITPSDKPFTVESATALTEATGTQFSIDATSDLTEIILTNGEVTVSSLQIPDRSVVLSPGERSTVAINAAPTSPELLSDLTEQLTWTGLMIFHYSPLESVALHLEAHYDAQIEVAQSLKDEAFKASFDPDTLSLSEALETLTFAFDATVDTIGADSYLLTPQLSE